MIFIELWTEGRKKWWTAVEGIFGELFLLAQAKKKGGKKVESCNVSTTTSEQRGRCRPRVLFKTFSSSRSRAVPSLSLSLNRALTLKKPTRNTNQKPQKTKPAAPPETSGLRHLGPAGVARATDPKANPFEKKKNAKSGAQMWTEVYELAELLRSGKSSWEDLDLDDVDVRLKVRREFFFSKFFFSLCFFIALLSFSPLSFFFFFSLHSSTSPLHTNSGSASSTAGSAPRGSS